MVRRQLTKTPIAMIIEPPVITESASVRIP